MGKVIDTTGRKIADTLGPVPTSRPQPRVEVPADNPRSMVPAGLATAAIVLAMLGGFGLLYAQNAETGGRVEVRMARAEKLDERIDGLTSKLDAVGTDLIEVGTRLQTMAVKLDGVGSQVSAGLRDANRSISETLNTSLNALSQRLAAQQQPREQRTQQAPSSPSTAPRPYAPYPGSIQPRRTFPY